jgi:hypothetical protein
MQPTARTITTDKATGRKEIILKLLSKYYYSIKK